MFANVVSISTRVPLLVGINVLRQFIHQLLLR
jgi:hypothetical protein